MALFTDTVTVYQKKENGYVRTVIHGVQWSDVIDKNLQTGKLEVVKSANITFPEAVLGQIDLSQYGSEDAIFLGEVSGLPDDTGGSRMSDFLKANKGGIVRVVNDNTNRDFLKNLKVVVY